jgi:His-Xaa-Ser system radical SAM maturase HxsB
MSKFQPIEFYKNKSHAYELLPLRFEPLDEANYVITNMAGEYLTLPRQELHKLVKHQLSPSDQTYIDLRARHFLVDDKTSVAKELLAIKLRTKYSNLSEFTGLHIFVVSLRCEHSCPYCQVSRASDDKVAFDMTKEIADKSLDLALKAPSKNIKIEFQGGEPLLNFPLIQHIVRRAEQIKGDKNIGYVIATNLALINDEILEFCKQYKIQISTSLDGPKDLHNHNRPRKGGNSYEKVIEGIALARKILGKYSVSALMTTTKGSLGRVKEIIDEYVNREFGGIFLRPLSPYGFALKTKTYAAYDAEKWHEFFVEGLEYIIQLNRQGIDFREFYTATILSKMLTSTEPGYVDLMSPAGIGIGAVVYNYDGKVYASDESRMLAEMGENKFEIGHVLEDSYEQIFLSDALLDPLEESFAYSVPMCNDCAFESYCGADPVFHYGVYKDYVGRKPESEFCNRNMKIFKYLIKRMGEDPFVKKIFTEWAQPNA